MTTSKNSFKRICLATGSMLVAITILLLGGSGIVNAFNQRAIGIEYAEREQDLSCALTVNLDGSGRIRATASDGSERVLDEEANQIAAACGDEVLLSAEPSARWRFDHWQGVDDRIRQRPTITVASPAVVTAVFVPRVVTYEPVAEPFYNRGGELVTRIERLEPLYRAIDPNSLDIAEAFEPEIDVWYGPKQNFGQNGTPQQYLNILGRVSDKDLDLDSLSYTLNGGAKRSLNIGGDGSLADGLRLWDIGDFNIDIDVEDADLLALPDTNEIVITAEDKLGMQDVFSATVSYDPAAVWPQTYNIDWGSASAIEDVAQVVDGKWTFSADGVRVHLEDTGYDRTIAIGEGSFDLNNPGWTEFEALIPVTVHDISADGFGSRNDYNQVAPALGVVMRWQGHTTTPINCVQPKCGYTPVGGAAWYQWEDPADKTKAALSIWTRVPGNRTLDKSGFQMELNKTYIWKVRVENSNGTAGMYTIWAWEKGQPVPGPDDYLIAAPGKALGYKSGSLLLLSHHVDVTFGDVQIKPLVDTEAPLITDLSTVAGIDNAVVSWKTDEPATSRVDYWQDPIDVKTVSETALVADHSLVLQNLTTNTTYLFKIYSEDATGNEATFTGSITTGVVYTLEVTTNGPGTVTIDPDKPEYQAGEEVTLTAVPTGATSYFAGWSSGAVSDDNPLTLVMTENKSVQAEFELIEVGDFESYLPMTTGN